jgi:hypothetical protein
MFAPILNSSANGAYLIPNGPSRSGCSHFRRRFRPAEPFAVAQMNGRWRVLGPVQIAALPGDRWSLISFSDYQDYLKKRSAHFWIYAIAFMSVTTKVFSR